MPDRNKSRKERPAKITPRYLERAALSYLDRYGSTTANFRRVMARKVARRVFRSGDDEAPLETEQWIEDLVLKLEGLGLLDDAAYAATMARRLYRRGRPQIAIRQAMKQKGLSGTIADGAMATLARDLGYNDLEAGLRYARRRRLGPFRRLDKPKAERGRVLPVPGRAGFSRGVAEAIVDSDDPVQLEAEAEEAAAAARTEAS
jgi:regulatory protein